jgi:hypothetical protein
MAGLNIVSQRDFSSGHLRAIEAFVDRMQCNFYVRAVAGVQKPSKNIGLFDLCTNLKTNRGRYSFEYASFVNPGGDALAAFLETSKNLKSDSNGKPDPALYFSKIESLKSGQFVPSWYSWLHDGELGSGLPSMIEFYSHKDILFARFDMKVIKDISGNTEQLPNYNEHSIMNDGVYSSVLTQPNFIKWGVETIAVWNVHCCNQVEYYKNIGSWSYSKVPIFKDYLSEIPGYNMNVPLERLPSPAHRP